MLITIPYIKLLSNRKVYKFSKIDRVIGPDSLMVEHSRKKRNFFPVKLLTERLQVQVLLGTFLSFLENFSEELEIFQVF